MTDHSGAKIAAIIAEYNPFHNGHAYHIAQTRARGADYVVCILDGALTQRGEFAALSRRARARAALLNGADAVVELPSLFACRSADCFARAGVTLAAALGADALSFGSETDDLPLLRTLAEMKETAAFQRVLRAELARGLSQPKARARAAAAVLHVSEADIPRMPNSILAVEYLRALNVMGSHAPKPLLIPRLGEYHSMEIGSFSSAGAIRAAVRDGLREEAEEGVPANAREQLDEMIGRHNPDDAMLYALRTLGAEGLSKLVDVSEGLEYRLFRAALEASTLKEALDIAECKRYPRSRLSRMAMHALTGLTAELASQCPAPGYIRLIGMRSDAKELLSEISRRSSLPLCTPAQLRDDPVFQFECRATDLWALTRDDPAQRRAGQEWTEKFLRI